MLWVIPLSLLILFEIIADFFAKEWSLHQTSGLLWTLAIGAYIVANTFWLFALRNGVGLGRGAIIFSVSSAALAVILGFLIFKEEVTLVHAIGITLGLLSIILLVWD